MAPIYICDEGGLTGQIVVNAANDNETIDSSVCYDACDDETCLSGLAYYSNLSATFGGGAVGQIPYHMHALDCIPADGGEASSVPYGPNDDLETLVLRFYGPVYDATDDDAPPVVVWMRELSYPTPGSWSNVTADCDITVAPPGHEREAWVSPKSGAPFYGSFPSGFEFRVVPKLTDDVPDLICDLAFTPTPVAGFEYNASFWCARL